MFRCYHQKKGYKASDIVDSRDNAKDMVDSTTDTDTDTGIPDDPSLYHEKVAVASFIVDRVYKIPNVNLNNYYFEVKNGVLILYDKDTHEDIFTIKESFESDLSYEIPTKDSPFFDWYHEWFSK
jgi:hypothetical protein